MRAESAAIFITLHLAFLAGCVSPEPPAERGSVVSFEAEYVVEDEFPFRMHLGERERILNRHGEFVEALPLVREYLPDGRHIDIDWLDANLRIIRTDDLCDRERGDGCETASFEWGRADFPAYLPLDLYLQGHNDDAVAIETTYETLEIPVNVRTKAGRSTYELDLADLPPRLRDFIRSSATFEQGEIAPTYLWTDPTLRDPYPTERVAYTPGEKLDLPAAAEPPLPRLLPYEGQGRYFPGEDETAFDTGYTHLELIDGMAAADPEIVRAAAAGCLRSYVVGPPLVESDLPEPAANVFGRHIANMRIAYAEPDGTAVEWEADVYETLEGPRFDVKGQRELPTPPGCEPERRYWPSVHATEFVSEARDLIDRRHPFMYFAYHVDPPYWLPGLSEQHSWHSYQALFLPAWTQDLRTVGFKALRVTMDADSGLLVDVITEASDHAQVDDPSSRRAAGRS